MVQGTTWPSPAFAPPLAEASVGTNPVGAPAPLGDPDEPPLLEPVEPEPEFEPPVPALEALHAMAMSNRVEIEIVSATRSNLDFRMETPAATVTGSIWLAPG